MDFCYLWGRTMWVIVPRVRVGFLEVTTEGALVALPMLLDLYDAQGMVHVSDAMPCDGFGRPFAPLF